MLFGLLVTALAGLATAALGPQPLYVTLSSQTLHLGGFLIQPYTEITQITAGANYSCGQFVTYDDGGGVYTAHQYAGGSTAGACGATPRSFDLGVVCGAATALTGVFEAPVCMWHGVLETPAACGVSMVVGQEMASVSATPSNSPTASATRTPAFFFTAFPTVTPSAAVTPSGTPLFMVTAWPTPTPVNGTPSSTPQFFMTAYPTPGYGNGSALGAATSSGGSTATILGAVAVGGMGLAAVGAAIMHFKKGGSIKDLFAKLKANKGKLQALTKDMPLPDSVKKAIANPDGLLPESAKKALAKAASLDTDAMMERLGVPDSVKSMVPKVSVKELAARVAENPDELLATVRDPSALKARAAEALKKKAALVVDQIPIPKELQSMAKSVIESAGADAGVTEGDVTLESVVEIKPDEDDADAGATVAGAAAAAADPVGGNTIEHLHK